MINATVQLWLERFRGLQSFVFDSGINCHCDVTTRNVYPHDPKAIAISFRMTVFNDDMEICRVEEIAFRTWDAKSTDEDKWEEFRKSIQLFVYEDVQSYEEKKLKKEKERNDDLHD